MSERTARPWGYWTRAKLAVLNDYLPAFLQAASSKSQEYVYLDAFGGEGRGVDRLTGEEFHGSLPIARRGGLPTVCGSRSRSPVGSPQRGGAVRVRAASCSDSQMQCLALASIINIGRLRGEHQSQRIDDVGPCLIPRSALAEDAGDLGDRRDDPAFIARLINDR